MALQPAPHPMAVFRVLKQAWRDYLASGNAQTLTVTTPPAQLATAATPVAGAVTVDQSVPMPVPVTVTLNQGGPKGTLNLSANPATGSYSGSFPAASLIAGSATLAAQTPYGAVVNSGVFTVT